MIRRVLIEARIRVRFEDINILSDSTGQPLVGTPLGAILRILFDTRDPIQSSEDHFVCHATYGTAVCVQTTAKHRSAATMESYEA